MKGIKISSGYTPWVTHEILRVSHEVPFITPLTSIYIIAAGEGMG
jgi:hypothetical protein